MISSNPIKLAGLYHGISSRASEYATYYLSYGEGDEGNY